MNLRSSSLFVTVMVFVLLATTACGSPTPTAAPTIAAKSSAPTVTPVRQGTVYKIGFMAAVTGPSSSLGEPERDVALMMQKQLDAQGGITGPDGVVHPVKVIIMDSEGSGDVAVPVAKKLINDEGVAVIIGPTASAETMALIPVVQEAEIPMISMASSSGIVEPVAQRKWVFKVAQSNKHTSPWQARYAKAKGLTKIANVYVNNAYGEDGAAAIRETAKAEGLEIVLETTFEATDTDMTAQITKIKASGAQAVLVTAIPPAAAIFTKQYRELSMAMPLLHNSGVGMKSFIDLSGSANAEGVIFPIGKVVAVESLPDSDPQKAVLKTFVADYQAATGKFPNQFAAHSWDCFQIVLNVLKTLPDGLSVKDQRIKLRDGIENTRGFVGADGVFNFSSTDHVGLSLNDVVLVRIQNGQWVYFPPDKW
jgi:branched-chain amino acid transport system substrate-binding protein